MLTRLTLFFKTVTFLFFITIAIYAEIARRKKQVYLAKHAWPYIVVGFGALAVSTILNFLYSESSWLGVVSILFFAIGSAVLLFAFISVYRYNELLRGRKSKKWR